MPLSRLTYRNRLRERLGESTAYSWTDAELNTWIYEGAIEVAMLTECLPTQADISVLANQYVVFPPADTIRIHRVEWINETSGSPSFTTAQVYPLEYRSINNLDSIRGTGQQSITGIPRLYATWGYQGTSTFRVILYPRPTNAGVLRVWYYQRPPEPVSDGSNILIPDGWEHLILDYAEYRAKMKDRDQDWQAAKAQFNEHIAQFKKMFSVLVDENEPMGVDAFYGPNEYNDLYGGWY
jgi:hypothetical protein